MIQQLGQNLKHASVQDSISIKDYGLAIPKATITKPPYVQRYVHVIKTAIRKRNTPTTGNRCVKTNHKNIASTVISSITTADETRRYM